MKDIIVIGGGPGGIAAAIYAKRLGQNVAIINDGLFGGQMNNTEEIENYIGIPSIKGRELSKEMETHLRDILSEDEIIQDRVGSINKLNDGTFEVSFDEDYSDNAPLLSKKVIIATGSRHRELGIQGEQEFAGRGVSYCALCDGPFFKNKVIAVVGGGNSAIEESIYLSNIAKEVVLIHRRQEFRADEVYLRKLRKKANVRFLLDANVKEIKGNSSVESITVNQLNSIEDIEVSGIFIYVGCDPVLPEVNGGNLESDEMGYLIVNPSSMETSIEGLYAIGDLVSKPVKQIITATNDGAIAAKSAVDSL